MPKQAYLYTDNDDYTDVERDICGKDYYNLIDICFKYSVNFSIDAPRNCLNSTKEIDKYETHIAFSSVTERIWGDFYLSVPRTTRKYYMCNQQTKGFVYKLGSIFSYLWKDEDRDPGSNLKKVENLIFYREDLTVFFKAETHEGYCFLYPQNNENVSDIVDKNGWILKTIYGDGYYK